MPFSHYWCLLLLLIATAAAHQITQPTSRRLPFTLQWSSYDDIQRALAAATPTVQTSLGNVTYRLQSTVGDHKVFRATADGPVRSVLVQSREFATVMFTFEDGGEITVTASAKEFKVEDRPPKAYKCGCPGHDHDSASSRRRFQAAAPWWVPTYPIWEGDGTVLGARVSMPFFRSYRVVYGSYDKYINATVGTAGNTTELFEARLIALTETVNEWYERELGIHLVYTAFASTNVTLYSRYTHLAWIAKFFNDTFGFDNYDLGMYVGDEVQDYAGMTKTEAAYRDDKGGAYGSVIWHVVAHEIGHMLGALHPHQYSEDMEPHPGTSIMGYGSWRGVFNLGSLLRMNQRYHDRGHGSPVPDFHVVNNTNKIPQINTALLRKAYHIPHSTSIRFIVDANDADEDDQINYYVQQMNVDEAFLRIYGPRDGTKYENDEYYMRGIRGIPTLSKEKVTNSREFYFTEIYTPRIVSRILNYTELARYAGTDPVPETRTYDMFICAFDSNKKKRDAYFSAYDSLVRNYTLQMVKIKEKEQINLLNETMRAELKKLDDKAWINRRDTFHTKVIAHANYTPFTLRLTPRKETYTAGEEVTLSWDCDPRTIPARDHLTFRLSNDSMVSFPFVLASHVPMENKTINITMPHVPIYMKSFFLANSTTAQFPEGFILVEHEEGIVFTTTMNRSLYPNENVYGGGFTISAPHPITQYQLRYKGSVIQQMVVKDDNESVRALMGDLAVYNKDGRLSSWSYVLSDESGKVIGTFGSYAILYATQLAEKLRSKKGTYVKVAAKITLTSSWYDSNRLADMQAWGYKAEGNDFVTNAIDIKMHSPTVLRSFVPQRNSGRNVTDNYTGVSITEEDIRSAEALQERAAALGSTKESEASVISISKCDDQCGTCEDFIDYIADGECHQVPGEGEGKYYIADSCGESDEGFHVTLFETKGCPDGTGTKKNFSSGCVAMAP